MAIISLKYYILMLLSGIFGQAQQEPVCTRLHYEEMVLNKIGNLELMVEELRGEIALEREIRDASRPRRSEAQTKSRRGELTLKKLVAGDEVQYTTDGVVSIGEFLPFVLWFEIFSYLPIKDLYSASTVCRVWHSVISSILFLDKNGPWTVNRFYFPIPVDFPRLFVLMGNVSHLTLDLSLVNDLSMLKCLQRLVNLEIFYRGPFYSGRCSLCTEEISATLQGIIRQVKEFSSYGIPFKREEQVFLSRSLTKARYVDFYGSEPLKAEDFQCMLRKLHSLKGIKTEVDVWDMDLNLWAKIINDLCGKVGIHQNMVDLVPRRLLTHRPELYSRRVVF